MRLALLIAPLLLSGCHLIKTNIKASAITDIGGERSEMKFEFKGSLDELPAALDKAYEMLAKTTDALIDAVKKAAAAPPPGQVRLRDLAPGLSKFEGKAGVDFLASSEAEAAGQSFQYVRIGAPSYDRFFEASMTFYALTWQATQSAHRLRQVSAALLEQEVDQTGALFELMSRALKVPTTPTNQLLKSKAQELQQTVSVLAELLPAFVEQTQALISTGQALVAGAAASITNPKVLLHLDLIKQGLEESVGVLVESGSLMAETVEALTGF